MLKKIALSGALVAASLALPHSSALAWSKGYVVEWIEPAFYYGAQATGGSESIGTDCPTGINQMDWDKLLQTSYRSDDRVKEVRNPEYSRQLFLSHLGFRGPHKENIYENPTSLPDPGLIEVSGKIGEGFDLDDNPNTGFVSPDGVKGVDNAFYKVSGCINFFRGIPRQGFAFKDSNQRMRDGRTTVLVVMSGTKDPMNDNDVTIGTYTSKEHLAEDANNAIAYDFSYNIDPTAQGQTIFKAKIENGVLTFLNRPEIRVDFWWREARKKEPLHLYQTQGRLEIAADGSMKGMMGGYRLFREHYAEVAAGNTVSSAINENLGHYSLSAWYYGMRREADGLRDEATGKNRGVSTTYRLSLVPAFVIRPDDGKPLQVAEHFQPGWQQ